MKLSRHFEKKWIRFMGFKPDAEILETLVGEAICIQKGRKIYCRDYTDRVPTIKWDYKRSIIYLIDDEKQELITFYAG